MILPLIILYSFKHNSLWPSAPLISSNLFINILRVTSIVKCFIVKLQYKEASIVTCTGIEALLTRIPVGRDGD